MVLLNVPTADTYVLFTVRLPVGCGAVVVCVVPPTTTDVQPASMEAPCAASVLISYFNRK